MKPQFDAMHARRLDLNQIGAARILLNSGDRPASLLEA
jgi:hypothetical protein